MLRASLRKIRSAPKSKVYTILGVGLVAFAAFWWLVIVIGLFGLGNDKPKADYLLQTKSQAYQLEAAMTPAEREKGLGGRSSLAPHQGMLFVFPEQKRQCFWMKNTLIPLDIIWADTHKNVTYVQHGVRPDSYPEQYCADAKYVIELNAGHARKHGITDGRQLDF